METRRAVGTVFGTVAGAALVVVLEVHVFEKWPVWALLAIAAYFGVMAWLMFRRPDPDRGKTPWERKLPDLEALIQALRACDPRETLDPRHQVEIRELARGLNSLGVECPPVEPLTDPALLRTWEIYLWVFTSKVRMKDAANLRPVWGETRKLAETEQARRAVRERTMAQLLGRPENDRNPTGGGAPNA
ncbi:MAG: hypothetical protein F4Z15_06580 [Gammaproteobacteria bacterium]|nr:hypothetical protein [Gammaproteobacteria bacterium]MYE92267.1 hypothetical protein [Gemmatimonadota bacterium]MYJ12635.1 hypothetical protein [Gemmatimonadota bacterium]